MTVETLTGPGSVSVGRITAWWSRWLVPAEAAFDVERPLNVDARRARLHDAEVGAGHDGLMDAVAADVEISQPMPPTSVTPARGRSRHEEVVVALAAVSGDFLDVLQGDVLACAEHAIRGDEEVVAEFGADEHERVESGAAVDIEQRVGTERGRCPRPHRRIPARPSTGPAALRPSWRRPAQTTGRGTNRRRSRRSD